MWSLAFRSWGSKKNQNYHETYNKITSAGNAELVVSMTSIELNRGWLCPHCPYYSIYLRSWSNGQVFNLWKRLLAASQEFCNWVSHQAARKSEDFNFQCMASCKMNTHSWRKLPAYSVSSIWLSTDLISHVYSNALGGNRSTISWSRMRSRDGWTHLASFPIPFKHPRFECTSGTPTFVLLRRQGAGKEQKQE